MRCRQMHVFLLVASLPGIPSYKAWMGSTHFLMRSLKHVCTAMSLNVLAYNLKRVMRIWGTAPLMQAMGA